MMMRLITIMTFDDFIIHLSINNTGQFNCSLLLLICFDDVPSKKNNTKIIPILYLELVKQFVVVGGGNIFKCSASSQAKLNNCQVLKY